MSSFNKERFSKILNKILLNYDSITEMANEIEMDRGYLSKYLNAKLDSPPSEKIIRKIAEKSEGITDYNELMRTAGFYEMIEENNLLISGDTKYVSLLFEGQNITNNEKIHQMEELIKGLKGYVKDCNSQIKSLEEDEVSRIIRKDTIDMLKEEILRTNEKVNGLKIIIDKMKK